MPAGVARYVYHAKVYTSIEEGGRIASTLRTAVAMVFGISPPAA